MANPDSPAAGSSSPGPPDELFYVIRDLAQLKALADPLRVRILEAFCEQPRTTKQVADRLGEKPTKLYHHVEALDRAGLIELHSTRPNRGTLEKYFLAIARAFKTDPALFSTESDSSSWASLTAEMLERSAAEIRTLGGGPPDDDGSLVVQAKITANREQIEELRGAMQQLLEDFASRAGDDAMPAQGAVDFQLVIALYPLAGFPGQDSSDS